MTRAVEQRRPGQARTSGYHLAAGWYIALSSAELRAKPRALDLFARKLVAWRDGGGRAVIMSRHCPHLGASLALGKVVDGCLRCPFHHWRFAGSGACVDIPGVERIPEAAHQNPYPVVERYGYIWAWYGGAEPMYGLPDFPALESERQRYLAYRFTHTTPASARRVLENAFDYYHFMTLHGVKAAEPVRLTTLSDPQAARENGPPIAAAAWSGALLEAPDLQLPRAIRALGIQAEKFSLLVDGWPGGQRLTFFLDGQVIAKELLGVSPVAADRTILRGWSLVRRSGQLPRDVLTYAAYRAQHWLGTREDLAIYKHAGDTHSGVPVKYDHSVLRFRKHYKNWVERAERADRTGRLTP
jgi:nitrite reductase/ring-hydroxylating ferredoxin subunit